ncbi:MAG TPA: ATP-binding protein, partial [Candidatus Paceibacterota bacterium]|nr:ATP-binding protein [Candidatus Paceibacterota bacterium]
MEPVKKLCITGGPCAGKSTGLAVLSQKLSDRGFVPLIVPEMATLLISGNIKPDVFGSHVFQTSVIRGIKALQEIFAHAALANTAARTVLLCDRGFADSAAYVPGRIYQTALEANGIASAVEARDSHYDAVFHLVSAAIGAEAFYTTANNAARKETIDEARALDEKTLSAWIGHPHLRVIDNSTDFDGKIKRLDKEVCVALGIPVPLEIELKYECAPVALAHLPANAQHIDIEQMYLVGDSTVSRRIRKRGQHGAFTYYYTEKRDVSPGVRAENERL